MSYYLSEAEVKQTVDDYLQYAENQGRLIYLKLNAGGFPTQSGHWATGVKVGCSDRLIVTGGRTIFCELKSSKGRLSKAQREFGEKAQAQGAEFVVVRTLEELGKILWKEGIK